MGAGSEEKMAKQTQNKLKNALLFSFVIISVVLVAFQWVDGLIGEDTTDSPGFVRPTLENFNVDDGAYQNWNQLDETQSSSELTPTP